jgi:Skp family chaperone for outer membrane proteins
VRGRVPPVVKEMSLFMLTERVDPSEVEACFEQAKHTEKEAQEAKSEFVKRKDKLETLNREFKTLVGEHKALKAKVK